MKKHILLILIAFLNFTGFAQDYSPQSQFAKDFLPVWTVSMKNAIDVAEAMPEELYSYQPNDSSKTFGDQIGHIAFTAFFLSKGFVSNEWGEYKDPDTSDWSKGEVVEYLTKNLEAATYAICSMTEEQANETIKAFGGKMVKRYIAVLFIQDHLTNHRAKANLYVRMNDIKPPAYAYFN